MVVYPFEHIQFSMNVHNVINKSLITIVLILNGFITTKNTEITDNAK